MKTSVTLVGVFFIVIYLSGCATTRPAFSVQVDAISSEHVNKTTYILLPGNKETKIDDLQFKEYATYVNRALIKQGFIAADSIENANIAIFLIYGIGQPQEHEYSYSTPTFGQTGVSSSTTTGTLSSYGRYGSYSGTTTYTPKYGVTGSSTHIGTYTTYTRFMVLDAIDLVEYKETKKELQLWRTTVTSVGSSGDLRIVFPILVAASNQYIAKNTGQIIEVNLDEEDGRVIEIKGIAKSNRNVK